MAVSAGAPRRTAATTYPPIPLRRRLYGFGSIFGKTIRDSRLAFIIAAGLFGGLSLVLPSAIGQVFPTPQARHDIDKLVTSMPSSMVNLFGNATLMGAKLGTLGGYFTWKYGATFALGAALWSILALSGTLAGEASRGSLDFVAAAPFGKRRISLEKLAAHLTLLWLAMAIVAVLITVASSAFGDAALGDPIPLSGAAGFVLWVGFIAMCFGGLAFALSPLLGRGGSAGVAGTVMFVLWVASGLDVGGPLVAISPFHWTADHIPLVGLYDWPGLAAVLVVALVLLVLGVELFNRRDLGVTAGLSLPGLPNEILGVRGPIARAFGDQLPRTLAWGIGMGLMGGLLASITGSFAAQVDSGSSLTKTFGAVFPGYDFTTASGWLQLYIALFYIAAGFAGATLVSKWASDETSGRLEEILTVPLSRARWVISGGSAAIIAVAVMTVIIALAVAAGAAVGGATAGDALLGSASLGLFALAIVGVGFAVGGLWRTSLAAEIAALVVVATYLIDLLAPALKLPDWFHQLALTAHFGQPMLGRWDASGVVACVVIAVVGIALGAWGIGRRDVVR
ncbi:MAG: ABC transporter permease subunit [Candidatus Limnocylindrales bacterium]